MEQACGMEEFPEVASGPCLSVRRVVMSLIIISWTMLSANGHYIVLINISNCLVFV